MATITVKNTENPNIRKIISEFEFETDHELIDRSDLGKLSQKCKLCGAAGDFQTWLGIEMFMGTKDEFHYFECPVCDTLQIDVIPDNVDKYYQNDYYSYREPVIEPVRKDVVRDSRMILDVGCGAGQWLCSLASMGFINLYGCDPYIKNDLKYKNGVAIKKCQLHEMEGQYDIIRLSYSFEHMPDPHEVFKSLNRLLKNGKGVYGEIPKIEINIPVYPNMAFDIYGPYWYQIDPPRHFFIHSAKGMRMLAEENDFKIDVKYKDQAGIRAFYVSRMYQLGVPFFQTEYRFNHDGEFSFLKNQSDVFGALINFGEIAGYTDEALFTLIKK